MRKVEEERLRKVMMNEKGRRRVAEESEDTRER